MSKLLAILAAFLIVILAGCSGDQIVGRYKTAICEDDSTDSNHVQVDCSKAQPKAVAFAESFATSANTTSPSITALSDRGQAAYIVAVAHESKDITSLQQNLATPLKSATTDTEINRTVFHRTIVVTVRRDGAFNPADRLEATDVLINLPNGRFDSWDTVATAYTTINAGSITLTQTHGTTEGLTVGAPTGAPVSGSVNLAASQSEARAETLNASNQVETLTVTVEGNNNHSLRIHRQGGYGIDLTGNTVVKVDISLDPENGSGNPEWSYLFSAKTQDSRGNPLPFQQAKLLSTKLISLPPGKPLQADVTLLYTLRHVLRGGSTYEERDDDVLEHTFAPVKETVNLIPSQDVSPPGFSFHLAKSNSIVMALLPERTRPNILCFKSYSDAEEFFDYLKFIGSPEYRNIGRTTIGESDGPPLNELSPLTYSQLANGHVESGC
ncbi:hypothetical protein ACELLULO517_27570 [Acidisoma cellulosilytica]|uniref:Uncharacterized protein n=1 Tax=Acidisoma cellulosilyticum TaxID=2802395 RepID=A0A964E6X1_9PROT|nr:hypothetical protein [Acidisoma cellulosilyticum]MCB8884026.1 hypothetical protein [Acidisoma cellulosilyticum]